MSHNLLNSKPQPINDASPTSRAVREFVAAMPIVMLVTAVIGAFRSRPAPARATTSRQFSTR
ncbi:MAG TPA: hypothetical protein VNU48_00550 [Burkholderiaceae bacterium]|nr:hypothetical protein [Burkholderiaceae bacterium]